MPAFLFLKNVSRLLFSICQRFSTSATFVFQFCYALFTQCERPENPVHLTPAALNWTVANHLRSLKNNAGFTPLAFQLTSAHFSEIHRILHFSFSTLESDRLSDCLKKDYTVLPRGVYGGSVFHVKVWSPRLVHVMCSVVFPSSFLPACHRNTRSSRRVAVSRW